MAPRILIEQTDKLSSDVITQLRRLAHDLSNSIETIMQASYLLAQGKLDANAKRWTQMIEAAVSEAAQINRNLRQILRAQSERSRVRRRAS